MLNFNANANFDGQSVTDNGTNIANFSASFHNEGSVYVSISVHDRAAYAEHKDMVEADFATFISKLDAPEMSTNPAPVNPMV